MGVFDIFLRIHAVFGLYVLPLYLLPFPPAPTSPSSHLASLCVHVFCVCDPVNFISLQEYGYINTYFFQYNLFFGIFFPTQGCIIN